MDIFYRKPFIKVQGILVTDEKLDVLKALYRCRDQTKVSLNDVRLKLNNKYSTQQVLFYLNNLMKIKLVQVQVENETANGYIKKTIYYSISTQAMHEIEKPPQTPGS